MGDADVDSVSSLTSFSVYSLFSALIMHVYQMRSSVSSVVSAAQERIKICMNALKEVSKVWLVAKMVHTLFDYILGNKVLEDKLQKAAGERHSKRAKPQAQAPPPAPAPAPPPPPPPAAQTTTASVSPTSATRHEWHQKRKFDDIDFTFINGPSAPQLSYERSRPQTPAATPSRDAAHAAAAAGPPTHSMAAPASTSPSTMPSARQQQQPPPPLNDTLMGGLNSRSITRPPTPFNPSSFFSVPASPPDLFLVTRNSPPISQSIWENFQPDQLFPDGSSAAEDMSLLGGGAAFAMPQSIDPQLARHIEPSSAADAHLPPPPPPALIEGAQTPNNTLGQRQLASSQALGAEGRGGEPSAAGLLPPPPPPLSSSSLGPPGHNYWPSPLDSSSSNNNLNANSPDETGSISSNGPIVPATLNMEDW
jgi:hypothetical protein